METLDHVDNVVLQLGQPLHNGLRFRTSELAKRYLRNELSVLLELSLEIDGRTSRFLADIADISIHHVNGKPDRPGTHNNDEFSVLIDNVEIVNDEQQRIDRVSAGVWLKELDEITHGGFGDSLYFSFVSGKKCLRGWPRLKDGKLDPSPIRAAITDGRENPNDVIEDRSEVMNNFAREHGEAERNRAMHMVLNRLRDQLLVVIADEWIFAFLKESGDLSLKIEDVLAGSQ